MLAEIVERQSLFICKIGTPLILFYHMIISNPFLNTAATDAKGIEWLANQVLTPWQYLCEGKIAILQTTSDGSTSYGFERRFQYDTHFFLKTATSYTLIPLSLPLGSSLKAIAYLFPETRQRAKKICKAQQRSKVQLHNDYYKTIGMEIGDWQNADRITSPLYRKHPQAKHRLHRELKALKAIVRILSDQKIPFWVDCGTCLGCYQYQGAIPHDWDIDIGILQTDSDNVKNALKALDPNEYAVQDWSGRAHPKSYLKVFIKKTGEMIEFDHFTIDETNQTICTLFSQEHNIFFPESWKKREKRYCKPIAFSTVFPLKKALFEGIEVPVPNEIVKYLQGFYGENLAPAKVYNEVTGTYEKDLSHPYWQLPSAH